MLSSMTGFGRAVVEAPFGRLTVEIQSVNRKYLEVFITLPKEFGRFEQTVRRQVSDLVSRGSVTVRIFLEKNISSLGSLIPDVALMHGLKKGWEKLAQEIGTDPKEISISFLMQYLPINSAQESVDDGEFSHIKECVEVALSAFMKMKHVEGKTLGADLGFRVAELERMLGAIEDLAFDATKKMRERLFEKMEELLKMSPETEERLMREVVLFAERADIAEEITRFKSHISQFKEILKGSVVGRKMDFLIQELGREINTIGSKSMEARIAHLVVDMKSELEKMREQIQNLE